MSVDFFMSFSLIDAVLADAERGPTMHLTSFEVSGLNEPLHLSISSFDKISNISVEHEPVRRAARASSRKYIFLSHPQAACPSATHTHTHTLRQREAPGCHLKSMGYSFNQACYEARCQNQMICIKLFRIGITNRYNFVRCPGSPCP
jgi:hypothetical protein